MLLSKPEITSMFRGVARLWCANKDRLSEIDSRFGDGDHGVTIGKIAGLITKKLDAWEDDDIEEFLQSLGDDTMEIGGGSAGPLYGTMIGGLSDPLSGSDAIDREGLKAMLEGCLAAMEDITTARTGDKTMMDALIPAVEAIQACDSADVKAILTVGAEAAVKGAEATKDMKANFGRARNYGERSIGYADSGASSWSCMFDAFAKAL